MKIKLLPIIFLFITLFVASSTLAVAAGLELTSIGGTSTVDQTFIQWTHAANNPKFVGTADPNAQVQILIDDASNSVTADSAGDWSFLPTTLTVGQYDIKITSGTKTIAFDLFITTSTSTSTASSSTTTSTDSATTKGGLPSELPATGAFETTLALISGGLLLIGLGLVSKAHFSELAKE